MSKIVFVKNCSNFEKVFTYSSNDDYRYVFTRKGYSLNPNNIILITFILDNDDLKYFINKKKLRELYCQNEEKLIKKLCIKNVIEFNMKR